MIIFSDHPLDEVRITGTFGQTEGYAGYAHRGIDYGCEVGTPVYWRGYETCVVREAEMSGSFGLKVRVDLEEVDEETRRPLWAVYAHLSEVNVVPGDVLTPGFRIGLSGGSGASGWSSWAPHLHWQVYCQPPGSTRDINDSRDPLLYTDEETSMPDHPHPVPDPYAVELNAALQMREDIRHYGTKVRFGRKAHDAIASGPYDLMKEHHAKLVSEGKI